MRKLLALLLALAASTMPQKLQAQQVQRVASCPSVAPPANSLVVYMTDLNGNMCTSGTGGGGGGSTPTSTYQGTLALTAATSTTVSTLTLSNGTAFPSVIGKIVIINTGTNIANICWFGGTCSASGGSEPLAAGASDQFNIAGTTSPTAFSASGTTLAVHN